MRKEWRGEEGCWGKPWVLASAYKVFAKSSRGAEANIMLAVLAQTWEAYDTRSKTSEPLQTPGWRICHDTGFKILQINLWKNKRATGNMGVLRQPFFTIMYPYFYDMLILINSSRSSQNVLKRRINAYECSYSWAAITQSASSWHHLFQHLLSDKSHDIYGSGDWLKTTWL